MLQANLMESVGADPVGTSIASATVTLKKDGEGNDLLGKSVEYTAGQELKLNIEVDNLTLGTDYTVEGFNVKKI